MKRGARQASREAAPAPVDAARLCLGARHRTAQDPLVARGDEADGAHDFQHGGEYADAGRSQGQRDDIDGVWVAHHCREAVLGEVTTAHRQRRAKRGGFVSAGDRLRAAAVPPRTELFISALRQRMHSSS